MTDISPAIVLAKLALAFTFIIQKQQTCLKRLPKYLIFLLMLSLYDAY